MTDPVPSGDLEPSADDLAWEFVASHVGLTVSTPPRIVVRRHRPGRGRVIEYRFEGGPRIFVKSYADGIEGLCSYRILRSLWTGQFGPPSAYRVPEPLAYLVEHRALLMAGAPGDCLLEFKALPSDAWESALRAAAGWLARLHTSSAALGAVVDVTQEASRLAGRLAGAVARRPELEAELVRLVATLADRAAAAPGLPRHVQIHGRYHAEHVFLAPGCVTVVDLDRAARGDPAQDVGEFLQRLRAHVARSGLGVEAADWATEAFLEEYERNGGAELRALSYYWSFSVLRTLLGTVRKGRTRGVDYHRSEFHAIPGRLRQRPVRFHV